jgi:ribosomal protein S18 acetylase RimI-like enzyme
MYLLRSSYPGQRAYDELKQAVKNCFFAHHAARPDPKPEEFWRLTGRDGNTPGYACIGLCWGDSMTLFSEHYLDAPIDARYPVTRSEIVEIGQFASFRGQGAGRLLMDMALHALAMRGHRCAVLTATQHVRALVDKLGVDFDDLGAATIERVRDKHIDWGDYYTRDPRVIAINLQRIPETQARPSPPIRLTQGGPASRRPIQETVHDLHEQAKHGRAHRYFWKL